MTQKSAAASALSSPVTPFSHSPDNVHLELDTRPPVVAARLPLSTMGCSKIEEKSVPENNKSPLLTTSLRQSPVFVGDDIIKSGAGQLIANNDEGSSGGNNRVSLKSPAAPCPVQHSFFTEERQFLRSSERSTGRQCLSGTLLVSPLPSPPAKQKTMVESRAGKTFIASASLFLPPTAQRQSGSSDIDGLRLVGNSYPAVSPRRGRLVSPVQHNLVYNNNNHTRRAKTMRIKGPDYSDKFDFKKPRFFSGHVYASCGSLRQEESKSKLSPAVRDDDLRLASDNCRMSPTSLQFSPPRDEKSGHLSESSLAAEGISCGSHHSSFLKRPAFSSPKKKCEFSLTRSDKGFVVRLENGNCKGSEAIERYLARRCKSAPSAQRTQLAGGVSCGSPWSRSLPVATLFGSVLAKSRSGTPAKEVILEQLHELRLKKDELTLMELEGKERRSIISEFIKDARELMVGFVFKRMTILRRRDEMPFSSLEGHKDGCQLSEQAAAVESKKGKGRANNSVMRKESRSLSSCVNRRCSAFVENIHCDDLPPVAAERQQEKCSRGPFFSRAQSVDLQQCQKEKKLSSKKYTSERFDPKHSNRELSPASSDCSVQLKVSKNRNEQHNFRTGVCFFETRFLYILSEEVRNRERIGEDAERAFHFLFCYHRIIENALQPSVIILQESCQWQNILIEATNELHRLQENQLDVELEQGIQRAREQAESLKRLVTKETHVRFSVLREEEVLERQKILRLFNSGVTVLMGKQKFSACKHDVKPPLNNQLGDVLFKEMTLRNGLLANEIHQRDVLYHKYKIAVGLCGDDDDDDVNTSQPCGSFNNNKIMVAENKTPTEVSSIANDDEYYMHSSNKELPLTMCPETAPSSRKTTLSTVQLESEIGMPLTFVQNYNNNHNNSSSNVDNNEVSFMHMTREDGGFDVGGEVFKWNPTSNILPAMTANTTAAATTSGSATVTVGEQSFCINNSSQFNTKKQKVVLCDSSVSSLAVNCQDASFASNHVDKSKSPSDNNEALIDVKKKKKNISSEKDIVIAGKPSPLRSSNLLQKGRCCSCGADDVDVKKDMSCFDTTQGKQRKCVLIKNRHIIPCSLKNRSLCKEKKGVSYDASLSMCQENAGLFPLASCGTTQLAQSAKRPYKDDVIFDQGSSHYCFKTVVTAPSAMNKPRKKADIISCGFPFHSLANQPNAKSHVEDIPPLAKKGKEKNGKKTEEVENDDNVISDSIEAFESIENWSQTATDDEYDVNYVEENDDEEEQTLLSAHCITSGVTNKPHFAGAELQQEEEGAVELSVEVPQRDVNTVPEISLSTMLETTAAMTCDNCEGEYKFMKRRKEKQKEFVDDVAATSFSTLWRNSVSESTASTRSFFEEVDDKNLIKNEKESDFAFSKTSFSGEPEPILNSENSGFGLFSSYPSYNYMRPTMSWLRHHEELDWQPTRRPLQDCGNEDLVNSRNSNTITTSNNNNNHSDGKYYSNKTPRTHHVTRLPFEEGPGVWMDAGMRRRAFGFDVAGNKAHEMCADGGQQIVVSTAICSPNRRRDASYRFLAEGSDRRKFLRAKRSATASTSVLTPNANGAVPEKREDKKGGNDVACEPAALEALSGVIDRRRSSLPSRGDLTKKGTRSPSQAMTPSYLDAFYKLDHQVAERKQFLTALRHGPVLRDLGTREAVETTPHRFHSQHRQRCSENEGCRTSPRSLSLVKSCSTTPHSSRSRKQKPWR